MEKTKLTNKSIIESTEYKLNMLSETWSDTVIIYISNVQFGEGGSNIERKVKQTAECEFCMCELVVNDWDRYLTPWKADVNMNGRVFQGQASELLTDIKSVILPKIKEYSSNARIYIAGYSLAGLFALWSIYECNEFAGVACCSGSLWYPGWIEYATQHSLKNNISVYLSLGRKEKNTKHYLIKSVEEKTQQQFELLADEIYVDAVKMQIHEGGHFNNIEERMSSGIRWLLEKHSARLEGD